ncbi:hypothetical protein CPB84DRAFT_1815882 [Gymnopilus junonius]|uniref:Novel STAND NTPase 1 domain-containing protein n=1 Tax=Gymnopilus junonius TaxID=109634 RepID=A0A9P5NML2_GYMJU|nr:hypothetical protein CPB84DRAFT_1815882 [Gymnopilus junonius]
MPLKPEVYYGRDALVEEIAHSLVKEETSRVCILGPGGMGKTSVSLAVVETNLVQRRFSRRTPVWVPCIGATSAPAFLETLYIQLQVPGDKQPTLEKIITELNASKDPRLIVSDNFETPWNAHGETQQLVGDIFRQLSQIKHIVMLVTMRGSYPPCDNAIKWQSKDIQPTDEEACFRIFHAINPASKDDPDVGCLLNSLGKEVHGMANDLMEAWLECGPDMFPDNPEKSMNRSISLSVDSDLVKQNPNAILLLSILSLLPAGTTKEDLRWWAPTLKKSMIASAIATLSKAAVLVQIEQQGSDSPILFVVPVVQSFMRQHGRISDEFRDQLHSSCCQYVLEHACRYDDSTFHVKSKALAAEDTNIHSILFDSPASQITRLSERTMDTDTLIAFCWHQCDTKPSLDIVEHTLQLANTFGIDRYIAVATWCLGKTYHQVAKYRLAYDHLLKAYRIFNSKAAEGVDLVDSARFVLPDRDTVVVLAWEVEANLMFVGLALQEAQRRQGALGYVERARVMLTALLTRVHYYDMRLPEVLAKLSENAFFEAFIAVDYGMVLYNLNQDAEAWNMIEIALMKASHVGDTQSVALAFDYIGYGYLRRGDFRNALSAVLPNFHGT